MKSPLFLPVFSRFSKASQKIFLTKVELKSIFVPMTSTNSGMKKTVMRATILLNPWKNSETAGKRSGYTNVVKCEHGTLSISRDKKIYL